MSDVIDYVSADIRYVPHWEEWLEPARITSGIVNVRFVGEGEVMSDGCNQHLNTDAEVL